MPGAGETGEPNFERGVPSSSGSRVRKRCVTKDVNASTVEDYFKAEGGRAKGHGNATSA